MKRLVLAIHFLYLLNIPIFSQWVTIKQPVPYGNDLKDVFFINDDIGWAVGSDGFIMKTTNTGLEWTHLESGTNVILNDVHFIDESIGWAVGDSGTVLISLDGGISWSEQPNRIVSNLNSVHFDDENIGWIVGENGLIIRTTNGGNIWEILDSGSSEMLLDVNFINDQIGFAVGGNDYYDRGVLLSTADGGNTWSSLMYDYVLFKIFFISDNIGWISGRNGIYKTIDGGNEWNLIYDGGGNYAKFYDIYFIDENNGYTPCFVGSAMDHSNHIRRTTDGGYTWFGGEDVFNYHLHGINGGIFMSSNGRGITVGMWGQILMTEDFGNVWKVLFNSYLHPIYDLAIRNNDVRYAIGIQRNHFYDVNQVIIKPLQDSDYWILDTDLGGGAENVGTIIFVNDSVGYASQSWETIHKTIDGGKTWELFYRPYDSPLPVNNPLSTYDSNNFFFLDETYGWFLNVDPVSLDITTDGGNTWIQLPDPGMYTGRLYFLSPEIGFSGGKKTTNGGYDWYYTGGGKAKFFVNDSVGFSVGNNGVTWKTTDVGETWQEKYSGTAEDLNDVYFINDNYGYAVGNNGIILATSNAGYSWHHQESGTTKNLYSIMFMDDVEGYIGGRTLLKTTNGGVSFIEEEEIDEIPTAYSLSQNYPNPFNSSSVIRYSVPQSSNVVIKVFDILGNEIETLIDEQKNVGTYEITWYADNLPSGIYLYQLRVGSYLQTRKMVLMK